MQLLSSRMTRGLGLMLLIAIVGASDRVKRQTPWKPIEGLCETCKPSHNVIKEMLGKGAVFRSQQGIAQDQTNLNKIVEQPQILVPNQPGQIIINGGQRGQPVIPLPQQTGQIVFPTEANPPVQRPLVSPDNIIGLNPPLPLEPISQNNQPLPGQIFPGPPIQPNNQINGLLSHQQAIISQADPTLNQIPVTPIPDSLPENLPQQFLIGNPPNVVGGNNLIFPGPFDPAQEIERQRFHQLEQQKLKEQQIIREQNHLKEQHRLQEERRIQQQRLQEERRVHEHRLQEERRIQEQRLQEQRLKEHILNEQKRIEEKRLVEQQKLQQLEQQRQTEKKLAKLNSPDRVNGLPIQGVPRAQIPNFVPTVQLPQGVLATDLKQSVIQPDASQGKDGKVKPEIIFKNKGEILNQPEKISQLQEFIANQLPDLKPGEKPPKVEVIYLSGNEALAGLANPGLLGQQGGSSFSQIAAFGVTPEQIEALQKGNAASPPPANPLNIPGAQAVSADQLSQLGIDLSQLPGIPKDQLANVQIVGINSADLQNNPNLQGLQIPGFTGLQGAQSIVQQVSHQLPHSQLHQAKIERQPDPPQKPKVPQVPVQPQSVPQIPIQPKVAPQIPIQSKITPQVPVIPERIPQIPQQQVQHSIPAQHVVPHGPSAHQLMPDRINSVPFTNHNQIIHHILNTLNLGDAKEIKLDSTVPPVKVESKEALLKQSNDVLGENENAVTAAEEVAQARDVTPFFESKEDNKVTDGSKFTIKHKTTPISVPSSTIKPVRSSSAPTRSYLNRVRGSSTTSGAEDNEEPSLTTPASTAATFNPTTQRTTTLKTFSSFPSFTSTTLPPRAPSTYNNFRSTKRPSALPTTVRSFTPVFTSTKVSSKEISSTEKPLISSTTELLNSETDKTTETFWQAQPKINKSTTRSDEISGKGYNNWEIYSQVRDALNQEEQFAPSLTTFSQKDAKTSESLPVETTDWKLSPNTASTPEFSQWVTKSFQKSHPTRAYATLSRTTPTIIIPETSTAQTLSFHVSNKLGTFHTQDFSRPPINEDLVTVTEASIVPDSPVTYHPRPNFNRSPRPTSFFKTTPSVVTTQNADANVSPVDIVVSSPSSILPETFIGSDEFKVPDGYSKLTLPLTYSELEDTNESDLPLAFIGPEDSTPPDGYIKIDLKDLPADGQEIDLSQFQIEEEKPTTKAPLKTKVHKNKIKTRPQRPTTTRVYPVSSEATPIEDDTISSFFPSFAQAKEKSRQSSSNGASTETTVKTVFGKRIGPKKRKKVAESNNDENVKEKETDNEQYELDTDASEYEPKILGISSKSKVSFRTKICAKGWCIDQD